MPSSAAHARIRFFGELNDHLPPAQKEREIEKHFYVPGSVKDMIESLGVPHTEVDQVVVNGDASGFPRLIRNGDWVQVYPAGAESGVAAALHLMPERPSEPKFVLDVHLGKLAGYLRMLGFDAVYANDLSDADLVKISSEEQRILLTRDRGVLRHSAVRYGYWLRETDGRRQTAEVVRRYRLAGEFQPLTRCMVCNDLLRPMAKNDAASRVPPDVLATCAEFRACPRCGRVYWEGSHSARMRRWMEELATLR